MGRILALLGGSLLTGLGRLFSGWRLFAGGLFLTIFIVYLYNLVADILEEVLLWIQGQIGTISIEGATTVLNATGLAAYLINQFRIPECVAFILTMILLKWTLRKIPFIRW